MPNLSQYHIWHVYSPGSACIDQETGISGGYAPYDTQCYTQAASGSLPVWVKNDSHLFWVAMGSPQIDQYVQWNNKCYRFLGTTNNASLVDGFHYSQTGPVNPPPLYNDCHACIGWNPITISAIPYTPGITDLVALGYNGCLLYTSPSPRD